MQTKRTLMFLFTSSLLACSKSHTQTTASTPECNAQRVGQLPSQINEASGVAFSVRNPGLLWVHNDDAPAILFAIDSTGAIKGRIRIEGLNTRIDWEDIAVAPCDGQSCVYIGDTGDNRHERSQRAIYRIPEPLVTDSVSANATAFYFDMGPRADDAEALFLHDNHIYLITKGRRGPITLYRFPEPLRENTISTLAPILQLTPGLVQLPDMVTGAGTTPDQKYVVIRTYSSMQIYTMHDDSIKPVLQKAYDLEPLHEFQGEGIDIRADGSAILVSEKGLSDSAPPISKVTCTLL